MKVLSVYFENQLNYLSEQYIKYLIDSGHNVYINEDIADVKLNNWLESNYHNVSVIDNRQLISSYSGIFFTLFNNDGSPIYIWPEIKFDLDAIVSNVYVSHDNTHYHIPESVGICQSLSTTSNDCKAIIDEIIESIIDTTIYLSKLDDLTEITILPKIACCNQTILQKIISSYDSENYVDLFLIQNIRYEKSDTARRSTIKIDLHQHCEKNYYNIELVLLSLLKLANSRKSCTYVFDVYSKSCTFSQFISLNCEEDVTKTICRLFPVQEFELLCRNKVFSNLSHKIMPDVCLCFDSGISVDFSQYSVVMYYNSEEHAITLNYTEDIYYFDKAIEHLDGADYSKSISINYHRDLKIIDSDFNSHETIVSKFESLADKYNKKNAAISQCGSISYERLNQKANQLAYYLVHNYHIGVGDFVAICMDRSVDVLVAMLAIMKSGAAYVPIDNYYPIDRINTIISESHAKMVVTDQANQLKVENYASLVIDAPDTLSMLNSLPNSNLLISISPRDIAYLIFTSGTTGKPKGVIIEHSSLMNVLTDIATRTMFKSDDKLLAVTTIAFDISTLELFMPLLRLCE